MIGHAKVRPERLRQEPHPKQTQKHFQIELLPISCNFCQVAKVAILPVIGYLGIAKIQQNHHKMIKRSRSSITPEIVLSIQSVPMLYSCNTDLLTVIKRF